VTHLPFGDIVLHGYLYMVNVYSMILLNVLVSSPYFAVNMWHVVPVFL